MSLLSTCGIADSPKPSTNLFLIVIQANCKTQGDLTDIKHASIIFIQDGVSGLTRESPMQNLKS